MSSNMFVCTHCAMEFSETEAYIVHLNAHRDAFVASQNEENLENSNDSMSDRKPSLDAIGSVEMPIGLNINTVAIKQEPSDELADDYVKTENAIEIKPMECDLDNVKSENILNPETEVKTENIVGSVSTVSGPFSVDFSKNIQQDETCVDLEHRPVLCTVLETSIRGTYSEVLCTLSIADDFREILDQETNPGRLVCATQLTTLNNTDDTYQPLYNLEPCTNATGQREYSLVRSSSIVDSQARVEKKKECTICHMKIGSDQRSAEFHIYKFHLLQYVEAIINDKFSKKCGFEKRKIVQILKGADKLETMEDQKGLFHGHSSVLDKNTKHRQQNRQKAMLQLERDNTETLIQVRKLLQNGTSNKQTELHLNTSQIPKSCPNSVTDNGTEKKGKAVRILDIVPPAKPDPSESKQQTETAAKYSCDTCGQPFKTKSSLIIHSRHHSDDNWYRCEECDAKFKYKHQYLNHVTDHKPDAERPFKCDECGEGFLFQTLLTIHSHTHKPPRKRIRGKKAEPKSKKSFTCDTCGQDFKVKSALVTHSRHHSEENWYHCEHCDDKFKYKKYYLNHVSENHKTDAEKPFKCDECGEGFLFKGLLSIHKYKHKEYTCLVCGKTFTSKDYLRCHERQHTGEKPHQCDTCGQCFAMSSGLYTHVKNNHSKPTHQCEFCDKAYGTKDGLEIHRRIHTGEKPFPCKFCDRVFRHKSSRRIHEVSHTRQSSNAKKQKEDPRELIHKCEFCDKAYRTRDGLRVHRRRHTGERPFKCEFCDKTFIYRASRKIHHDSHVRNMKYSDLESKEQGNLDKRI